MANEPGSAVLTLFSNLIDYIKQSRPVKSDGATPLQKDFFYSQMILGMPIDPDDFAGPWSPVGGDTLQDAIAANGLGADVAPAATSGTTPTTSTSTAASGATSSSGATAVATAPAGPDLKFLRAMQAAYKTSVLCNVALQVTSDGSYVEYPTGRHIDFGYSQIVAAMQALPAPPIDPAVQARIDAAKKVLYMADPYDPDNQVETPLYKRYKQNSQAYAQAKANFALQQSIALKSASTAEVWPMMAASYQQQVDDAYDTLKTEGAEIVEPAIATIESEGQSLQDHAIAAARKLLDVWSMNIGGAPQAIPYSFVMPTNWCIPKIPDDGFESLTVTSDQYSSTDASSWSRNSQGSWSQNASSTGGSGAISIGFAAFGGSGGSSSSNSQWQGSASNGYSNAFANDASDLTISLKYGLVTMYRPWLQTDLFSMSNWYLVNNKKGSISNGTVAGQVGNTDQLLPSLPMQFLVIKDVKIVSTSWGSDGGVLSQYYGGAQGSTQSSSSNEAGSAGVCLGFVNFGGSASHSQSSASGQSSSWAQASGSSYFGCTFDGTTLEIPGAQIIAFVCDIVPQSAPLDDPGLTAPSSSTGTASTTPASTTTTSTAPASSTTTSTAPASTATTSTAPASTATTSTAPASTTTTSTAPASTTTASSNN